MFSDTEVDDHAASIEMTSAPPDVTTGLCNQNSLSIVASQIPQDAEVSTVPYTGRNYMRKFLPPWRFEPAQKDGLHHVTMVRDICYDWYKTLIRPIKMEDEK